MCHNSCLLKSSEVFRFLFNIYIYIYIIYTHFSLFILLLKELIFLTLPVRLFTQEAVAAPSRWMSVHWVCSMQKTQVPLEEL